MEILFSIFMVVFIFSFICFIALIKEYSERPKFNKDLRIGIGITFSILIGGVFIIKYSINRVLESGVY